jgi:putative phosphoribosyl transferase
MAGERLVEIEAGSGLRLAGDLGLPPDPAGLVVFAHGSGSSRRSPRNRQVAEGLNEAGLATLLFDLLREDEECDRHNVFDIELLGARLVAATRWVRSARSLSELPIGYFGASTGAAAALLAAAALGGKVEAVVSRGGRPDLATAALPDVRSPTLLIVGGDDRGVLALNVGAASRLRCEHRIEVVPGATHLFEEAGTLQLVTGLASEWFLRHLRTGSGWDRPKPQRGRPKAHG